MLKKKLPLQFDINEYLSRSNKMEFDKELLEKATTDFLRSSIVCGDALEKATLITCADKSNVYYMSDSFLKLTGYTREETDFFGPNFIMHIMRKEDLQIMPGIREMAIQEVYSQRNRSFKRHLLHMIQYSYPIKRKDGKWISVECSAYPDCFIKNKHYFFVSYIKQTKKTDRLSIQIYFFRENIRLIYNHIKGKFIPAEKIKLNEIEYEILQLTATGHKEHQISKKTELDHNTIKYYKKNIMLKMSVNSMPEAVYYALKNGML